MPFLGSFGFPSYIGSPIYFRNFKRIFIGKRVRIYPNSRLEVVDSESKIIIEDNVSIAQNFHMTSGGVLLLKKNTTIAENVMITNIDHEYKAIDKHILDQEYIHKKTEIGENCLIGFGAAIQAGTILGKHCVVGANAVVRGVFPDYCVIVGVPGRIIKRYNHKSKIWCKTNSKGEFVQNI